MDSKYELQVIAREKLERTLRPIRMQYEDGNVSQEYYYSVWNRALNQYWLDIQEDKDGY